MEKSESILNLVKALVEVQKTNLFALTDKDNPYFNSKYADLSSVWAVIRKPLTDNNLCVIQTPEVSDNGVIIETILIHTSGEYISNKLLIKLEKNTPQGVGSAITYGRRYALVSIIGISPEDDDGENAMDREKRQDKKPNKNADAVAHKKRQDKEIADNLIKALQEITSIPHLKNWREKHRDEVNSLPTNFKKEITSAWLKREAELKEKYKDKKESEHDQQPEASEGLIQADKYFDSIRQKDPVNFDIARINAGIKGERILSMEDFEKFMICYNELTEK